MNDDTAAQGDGGGGLIIEGAAEVSPVRDLRVEGGLMEEVDNDIHLLQEEIPKILGEVHINAHEDGKKMILEGAVGPLGIIAAMNIQGEKLVRDLPLLFNGVLVFGMDFVVEDFEVNLVAPCSETSCDGIVGGDTVLVLFGFKWSNEDSVGVKM